MKHIELDYHFIREKVADCATKVHFVCSHDQIADALTKSLSTARFTFLRSKLTVPSAMLCLNGRVDSEKQKGI
jgi:hypothetical protein